MDSVEKKFNGVACITCDQEVLLLKKQPPFDERTQFVIGSLSKQITAVLVLRAHIDLHQPIKSVLPFLDDQITVHHLLSHTSGIQADAPPIFKPGTQFTYSNLGYDMLGLLLERVSGCSYFQLVKSLFDEISSSHNTLAPSSGTIGALKIAFQFDTSKNPSGGIISTLEDLCLWNEALHSGSLLSKECYRMMTTPTMTRDYRWGKVGYGYGIQISRDTGIYELSHNGLVEGYASTLLYYPEKKVSLVVLEAFDWSESEDLFGEGARKRIFSFHDKFREELRNRLQ